MSKQEILREAARKFVRLERHHQEAGLDLYRDRGRISEVPRQTWRTWR